LGLSFFYAFRSFLARSLTQKERNLYYKQYKDGGLLKYLEDVTTINGVDRQEDQFLFVECRLYADKENNNFSDNQIFDEKNFKCFETLNGIKIYFTFIPCLIAEKRLKTFYVRTNKERKKRDLYKQYKGCI